MKNYCYVLLPPVGPFADGLRKYARRCRWTVTKRPSKRTQLEIALTFFLSLLSRTIKSEPPNGNRSLHTQRTAVYRADSPNITVRRLILQLVSLRRYRYSLLSPFSVSCPRRAHDDAFYSSRRHAATADESTIRLVDVRRPGGVRIATLCVPSSTDLWHVFINQIHL